MDFTPLFSTVINVASSAWYVFALIIVLKIASTPWFKGMMGEFLINMLAKWRLDSDVYDVLDNVTLPTEDGSTQIDHIIVSIYGVFVVETKNLRGWIYGKQHQKRWTQQIYRHKSFFQNPLHQNHKHIKTLQALLGLADNQLHSVVVFIGDSKFKTPMPDNVTHGLGYIRYIQSKTDIVISPRQRIEIVQAIETGRLARGFKTHRQHVKHVQKIVADKASRTP